MEIFVFCFSNMMTQHMDKTNKNVLICPIRSCMLPAENRVVQEAFQSHVYSCRTRQFTTQCNNFITTCPLGHILADNNVGSHDMCFAASSNEFRIANPYLVQILSYYTVIPYAFNERLTSINDIPFLTFNVNSSQDEVVKSRQQFFELLRQTVMKAKQQIHVQGRPPFSTFKPCNNHTIVSNVPKANQSLANQTLDSVLSSNNSGLVMFEDPYLEGFDLNLFQ